MNIFFNNEMNVHFFFNFGGKETVAKALYKQLEDKIDAVVDGIALAHAAAHDRCRATA